MKSNMMIWFSSDKYIQQEQSFLHRPFALKRARLMMSSQLNHNRETLVVRGLTSALISLPFIDGMLTPKAKALLIAQSCSNQPGDFVERERWSRFRCKIKGRDKDYLLAALTFDHVQ